MPEVRPHTLLLRLDGAMQSWGTDSKFGIRETRTEPSKSGVIGLVASALGRLRDSGIDDLAALRFGVRVDRAGRIRRDFHTAGKSGFYRAKGSVERRDVIVSDRFFLADACFTAGLEASDQAGISLLGRLRDALLSPHWPLFLGRRAFPPSTPVVHPDGIVTRPLLEALQHAGLPDRCDEPKDGLYRFVTDAGVVSYEEAVRQTLAGPDQPIAFLPRRYAPRQTTILRLPVLHQVTNSGEDGSQSNP